ncbi:MAG: copper amine oxidase N-terminal domain-containing protein [Defluviitaleaceae bacterium]|nr:copper amine oxidase N-terminal domain-containing protein [Defluviitaleaceae bacterium]
MNKDKLKGIAIGSIATLFIGTVTLYAQPVTRNIAVTFNNIRVAINGQVQTLENEPFIYNGRTYLPVADISRALGHTVTWEASTNTVHLTSGGGDGSSSPNYPAHNQSTPGQSSTNQPNRTGGTVMPTNIVPRSPSHAGAPTNPAISATQAVRMVVDHLNAQGITATFRYMYLEREGNQWKWNIEFSGDNEFYVWLNSGRITRGD